MRSMHPRAAQLIRELGLEPHPECGYYRRVHTSTQDVQVDARQRPACTAIEFLLVAGQGSAWHRIDADETWQWLEGGALALSIHDAGRGTVRCIVLGAAGKHQAAAVVPAGCWQRARPLGDFARTRCTVAPGFEWEGFELLDGDDPFAAELSRLETLHASGTAVAGR